MDSTAGTYCFKPTGDDWHGNFHIKNDLRFPNGHVYVHFAWLNPMKTAARVGVWGNDDKGYIKDSKDIDEIIKTYSAICLMERVDIKDLVRLDFEPF